ncbi:MAG: peptidylprolyl isomerase [Anaerolineae bacterium]
MAKRKLEEKREETRKQAVRRRRDAEANRRAIIALLSVGALVVLLIAAGIVQELVLKPNQPVAIVNGTRISQRSYQQLVKYTWFQQGQITDPEGSSLEVLDEAIDVELLREQARQRGIVVTEDEITETIEKIFGYQRVPPTPVPTPTPDPNATASAEATPTPRPTPTPVTLEAYQQLYNEYLARLKTVAGMSETDFRRVVEGDLLRQKLYEEITKDVPVTAEQVRARHILIAIRTPAPTPESTPAGGPTPEPDATPAPTPTPTPEPRDEAQALALITEIQQKLSAGEDFAELARQYSDDPGSKEKGGDLGWFPRASGFVQEFEEAAFKLQPGEVSPPVRTQFGYHLIKVEERDPARPLDEFTVLQNKYRAYQQWLTDLRNAAKIERRWSPDSVPATPSAARLP